MRNSSTRPAFGAFAAMWLATIFIGAAIAPAEGLAKTADCEDARVLLPLQR